MVELVGLELHKQYCSAPSSRWISLKQPLSRKKQTRFLSRRCLTANILSVFAVTTRHRFGEPVRLNSGDESIDGYVLEELERVIWGGRGFSLWHLTGAWAGGDGQILGAPCLPEAVRQCQPYGNMQGGIGERRISVA